MSAIAVNGHLSEQSVIYIKMTGLQDLYLASFFTDPFQKQLPEVLCKKGVLKNLRNFTGAHLRFPVKFRKLLRALLKNISERGLLPVLGFSKLNHNVFL